jgi:hypothetical protein
MVTETQELDDRWILPLRGHCVTAVDFGADVVTFVLDSGVQITVGYGASFTPGSIKAPNADVRTLAQSGKDAILRLVGILVVSAVGFKSGALRVVWPNGWQLNVRSHSESFVPAAVVDGDIVLWARTASTAQK